MWSPPQRLCSHCQNVLKPIEVKNVVMKQTASPSTVLVGIKTNLSDGIDLLPQTGITLLWKKRITMSRLNLHPFGPYRERLQRTKSIEKWRVEPLQNNDLWCFETLDKYAGLTWTHAGRPSGPNSHGQAQQQTDLTRPTLRQRKL